MHTHITCIHTCTHLGHMYQNNTHTITYAHTHHKEYTHAPQTNHNAYAHTHMASFQVHQGLFVCLTHTHRDRSILTDITTYRNMGKGSARGLFCFTCKRASSPSHFYTFPSHDIKCGPISIFKLHYAEDHPVPVEIPQRYSVREAQSSAIYQCPGGVAGSTDCVVLSTTNRTHCLQIIDNTITRLLPRNGILRSCISPIHRQGEQSGCKTGHGGRKKPCILISCMKPGHECNSDCVRFGRYFHHSIKTSNCIFADLDHDCLATCTACVVVRVQKTRSRPIASIKHSINRHMVPIRRKKTKFGRPPTDTDTDTTSGSDQSWTSGDIWG